MDKLKALNKKTVIAIIAICILAIIAIVGVVAFLNDDGSATAIDEVAQQENESKNATTSENVDEPSNTTENNSTVQENTSAENTNNTIPSESTNPTSNVTNQPSPSVTPTTSATGTTISTTNTNVPNQEYVTSRVEEVERQISEDLAVSWQNLNVAGKFADVKILDSNVTAEKFSSEEENTVIAGDEIVYSIEVKNIDKEAKKEIKVSDVVPEQTELIGVGELFEGDTVEIKEKDGITKIFWSINFEENEEAKILSFKVKVKENAQGTIRNVAVVDGNKTNETQNTIININKTSEIIKCDRNEKTGTTVHENDEIQYILTIQNTGDIAEKINVIDQIKEGLAYKTDSLNASIANAKVKVEDGTIILEDYELEAGVTLEISFVVIVKPLGTYIENGKTNPITQATIEANDLIVNSKEITDKTPEGEDKNYEVVKPYIETKKTSSVKECSYGMIGEKMSTVHEGDIIQYTIMVSNAKGTESEIINLSDTIPAGLNITGSVIVNLTDAHPQVNGNTITLNDYKLNAGSILEITFNTVVADLGTKKGTNGKEEKITSATISANEVNVNTIPTKDPDGPKEVKKPNIEIAKTSTVAIADQEYVRVGETFEYIIVATNKGTEKGSVVITDSVPSEFTINANNITIDGNNAGENIAVNGNDVTWNLKNLEVGKSRILKISVTAKDITGTKKETTNTAIINNGNPSASTDVTIGKSDIYVSKTSQVVTCNDYKKTGSNIDVVHENDEIQYTITVENKGVVSDKINVNDQLKSQVELVNGSLTAKVGENNISGVKTENGIISLDDYELAAGSKLIITFKVKVKPLGVDENGEKITNATFEANEVKVNNKTTTDPGGPENIKKADLNITKTSNTNGKYLNVEDEFEYTITATNTGTEIGSAIVTDNLPNSVKYISYTNNGDVVDTSNLPTIKWTVKDLEVGESRDLKIKVKAKDFTGTEQTIENKATIDNGNPDAKVTDKVGKSQISANKTSKVVACDQYGMIDSEGKAKVTIVHEGDEIEYTITITNSGKVAGIVNMRDPLPTGMTYKTNSLNSAAITAGVTVANDSKSISLNDYSLAANTTLTITFRVTIDNLGTTTVNGKEVPVTSATLTANKVTVNGDGKTDPNPPTDVKKPNINTTKTSVISKCSKNQTTGTTVHEGDKIKYTITVSNDGTEYKNINVSDTLKSGVSLIENTINAKDNGSDAQGVNVSEDKRTISMNGYRLEAGHTLTITFEVCVDTLNGVTKATIEANQVIVDGNTTSDKAYEVVKPNINVTKQVLNAEGKDINYETVDVRSTLKYVLVGTNTGDEDSNVTITDTIDITKLTDINVTGIVRTNETDTKTTVTYNKQTGTVSWSDLLVKNSGNQVVITIEAKTRNLEESEVTYTVENTAKYIPEGSDEKYTETVTNNVKIMIEANKTANVINTENDGKAEYGDIIEYTITAENKSENAGKVNIIDPLPSGVEYTETLDGKANQIVVKVNGTNVGTGSYDANTKTISYSGNVPAGETLTLTFKVNVTSTELNEDIVNKATINGVEKTATVDVVKKLSVSATAQVTKSMDLILVLDVSTSMTNNGVGRLTALKTAAKALVEKVFPDDVETDSTVTIIAYSKEAETSSTYAYTEKAKVISKINGLQSIEGTDINDGLVATNNLLTGGTLTNDKQVVIFLSDGAPSTPQDSTGLVEKGATNAEKYSTYQNNSLENIVTSAKNVKGNADMVYAIGLGTESGLSDSCAYVTECSSVITSSYTYDETNGKVIITLSNSSSKNVTVTKLTANISGISGVNSDDVTYNQGTLTWNKEIVVSANETLQLEVYVKKLRYADVQVSNIIPEYQIECSNTIHQAMNNVVSFDGIKTSNEKKYHYYTEKSLAKYVLKTIGKTKYIPISDGTGTSETTEKISKEFDAILKESSTVNSIVSTSTSPAILEIPEEANILGNVKLTIGEKENQYNITDLTNKTITLDTGDELTYISSEGFKGFKLTINNLETYKKELHLQYTVDKK